MWNTVNIVADWYGHKILIDTHTDKFPRLLKVGKEGEQSST